MRDRATKAYIQKERDDYLLDADGMNHRCQVWKWLAPHREFSDWVETFTLPVPLSVHHIFGRTADKESHAWCNFICVSGASHAWGHDRHPVLYELAGLRAKADLEYDRIRKNRKKPENENHWLWHPKMMARVIRRESLEGRIHELLGRDCVAGTIFHTYGQEILEFLGE